MDNLELYGYVILFAPFVATVLITCLTQKHKALSGWVAVLGMLAALGANVLMAMEVFGAESGFTKVYEIEWLGVGQVSIPFGVQVDALSTLMALVVTGVGLCIFVFSMGYMKSEEGYSRYFACLSLFAFSMLGIVMSTNLLQTFIFWELVGVSSYSLIGYYFHKDSAVDAGKKAFLTNRIGDFGMTWGIILLFYTLVDTLGWDRASFSFEDLRLLYEDTGAIGMVMAEHAGTLALATLLIFTGAVAKSAQVPLHVWLPDAMEGPTPVSALMHAATMVAAGVFLVCRLFFMFAPYPEALAVVAWMGGVTALLAAAVAFVQFDIKKVLAYSTLSQLGYMVLALGMGSPAAAMFHLTTHACFKALLFLGSGSVIHGCHHEQDMRNMGGLRKTMPVTFWTFAIGTLALAGIFPFAGFWSKDAILGAASINHTVPGHFMLYAMGVIVALMTAAYMGRCVLLTFFGEYRGHAHPHESPITMTGPLVVLAVASAGAGLLSLPKGISEHGGWLEHALVGVQAAPSWFPAVHEEVFHWPVAIIGTLAALAGLVIAYLFYGNRVVPIDRFVSLIKPLHHLLEKKYYFDELYLWIVDKIQQRVAVLSNFIEVHILRWIVDTIAAIHRWFGGQIRLLLDGHVHRYVTLALLGVVVILAAVLVGN